MSGPVTQTSAMPGPAGGTIPASGSPAPDVRAVTCRNLASMSIQGVLALYPGTDMIVFFEVAMHGPLMPAPRRVRWSTRPSSRIWIIPGACYVQRDGKTYEHAARRPVSPRPCGRADAERDLCRTP